GVDESVHRVGLAPPLPAAARALDANPVLGRLERRLALRLVVVDLRQHYREILLGNRHLAAGRAMDDRDRAPPVALAGEAPVAQPVGDRRPGQAALFQPVDDRALRLRARQARG